MDSELKLIESLRQRFPSQRAITGIGDDAAVIATPSGDWVLLCSDVMVEKTHFRSDIHPPQAIGFRAVAANVSDIGAMGGVPDYCVLTLVVPAATESSWVDQLFDGVARALSDFGVELVGGDTAEGATIALDVAVLGRVEAGKAVLRSGARPGDGIYVTGSLGDAARGLSLLPSRGPDDPVVQRHLYPTPRHRVGQAVRAHATAMIDISDGLSTDLGHLLEASGASARVDAALIPRHDGVTLEMALHGGEDYELIVTGRDLPDRICEIPLTRVGEIVRSEGRNRAWLVSGSVEEALEARGWQHFVRHTDL